MNITVENQQGAKYKLNFRPLRRQIYMLFSQCLTADIDKSVEDVLVWSNLNPYSHLMFEVF